MVILEHFAIVKITLKVIGMVPINLTSKNKLLTDVINAIPVILSSFLSLCIAAYIYIYPIFESSIRANGIIHATSVLTLLLTVLSGNGQCHFYKSKYRNINYQIQQIESNANTLFSLDLTIKLKRQYRRKVVFLFILFFVSQGILLYEVRIVSGIDAVWASILTSVIRSVYPIGILHIVIYCEFIALCVSELNISLRNSSTFFYYKNDIEFLKNIKTMHMDIWKVAIQINAYFGWNVVCLVTTSFIYMTVLMYWLFISLYNQVDVLGITGMFKKKIFNDIVCYVSFYSTFISTVSKTTNIFEKHFYFKCYDFHCIFIYFLKNC